MSLIRGIRVWAPRFCKALPILAGYLVCLFALAMLGAVQPESAYAQTSPQTAANLATNSPLRNQHFVCNVGYSRNLCHQQSVQLANTLLRYQRNLPDDWTWVLVRSEDWPAILRGLNLRPGSPAFSVLARRQTFLNEVLVSGSAQDRAELLQTFRVPVDQMLEIAVSHELGHAFCMAASEREADRFAEQLRKTGAAQCGAPRKPSTRDTMQTLGPPQ
jgi:hypothetical protein